MYLDFEIANGGESRDSLLSRTYWDSENGCMAVPLGGNDSLITRSGLMVVATVGVGVVLCLRDRQTGMVGMVRCTPEDGANQAFRLLGRMLEENGWSDNLSGSLYGGARLVSGNDRGAALIASIRAILHDWGVDIEQEDVGGTYARRVELFTVDGRAIVHKFPLGYTGRLFHSSECHGEC